MGCTIKDVAKEAGVSLGTVSNVLNKLPSVSESNRKRVEEAMEKLGYNPNYVARALKTRRSKCIGLIVPDISNPFYSELARGVEDSASVSNYTIFLCNSDRKEDKERHYIGALIEKMVDGLILCKTQLHEAEILEYSVSQNLVLVDTGLDSSLGCDMVKVDDYVGVQKALDYLWKFDHRRIALIAGSSDSLSSRDRVRSYYDFYRKKNHPILQNYIQYGHYDWHSGYACTNVLLSYIDAPTAILTANDLMAIGAIKAIQERGLNIPQDISVMGYDDIDMASLCVPPLTTVRQPKYEMGKCSLQMLLKRLNSEDKKQAGPREITLNTEIIVRNSVSYRRKGILD